jgi:hypothetical protein
VLIRADGLAQRYGGRVCTYLDVDPHAQPLLAYCVDEAAALAGILHTDSLRAAHEAQAAPDTPPAKQPQLKLIGGSPIVTGIVSRE